MPIGSAPLTLKLAASLSRCCTFHRIGIGTGSSPGSSHAASKESCHSFTEGPWIERRAHVTKAEQTRHQGSLLFCRREGKPRRRERKSRRNRRERDTTPPGSWPMEEGGGGKEKPIVAFFLQTLNTAQRSHNLHATPPTVPDYRRILGCLVGGTAQRGCVARHCRSRAPVP